MQRLVYVLVAVAAVTAVALSVQLFKRHARADEAVVPLPASSVRACPDGSRAAPPVLPLLSAGPLHVVAPDLELRVDGAPAGPALTEGAHELEAGGTRLKVQASPFAPVLVDARRTGEVVTLVVIGARCATCPHAETDVDLEYRRGGIGDVSGVARALSHGDWPLAAQQVRAIAPADFAGPEATRLKAALLSLAGRPTLARAQLALLPRRDPVHAALAAWEKDEAVTSRRQLETATARWNATTERVQRLTTAFAADAPEVVTKLTVTFAALTPRIVEAQATAEVLECEAVLEEATVAVTRSFGALRAMRPTDCAWQARVSLSPGGGEGQGEGKP